MTETVPFDDFRDLVSRAPHIDADIETAVRTRLSVKSDPLRTMGHLARHVSRIAGWMETETPQISTPLIAVFVGAHGISEFVLGQDPVDGGRTRVAQLTEGDAAVRRISAMQGAAFKVFEMGIEAPAADMRKQAALSEADCMAAIAFGMEVVAEGADIIVLGNAGYGSAAAAAAVVKALYGGVSEYWAGGQGESAKRRIEAVRQATEFHSGDLDDPLEILRRLGGRDIAGMVGAIIAARHQRIPVILDGFVVCAAAAVLHRLDPTCLDHCIAAHASAEPAHAALLDRLGKRPVLDLGIGIGDGTGGAIALGALNAALAGAEAIGADA